MIDELTYAEGMLKRGGYTLVICSGGRVQFSEEKGIRPLLELADSGEDWSGSYAADKIVGKAAAMLYAHLKVKAVFAEVLSESAKDVFEKYGVEYRYDTLTENIINRKGTGLCPMEETVQSTDSPNDALAAIRNKLIELKSH